MIILNSYGGTRRPNVLTNLKLRIKTWPVSRMQKYVYINMLSKQTYCTLCTLYSVHQRVCTSREEMGGGCGFFTQIEPNWPLPYSKVPVPLLGDARPAGWVTYCSICASTMPRAQNRAGKGSILLWRRLALAILLLFIYGWVATSIIFMTHRVFSSMLLYNTKFSFVNYSISSGGPMVSYSLLLFKTHFFKKLSPYHYFEKCKHIFKHIFYL